MDSREKDKIIEKIKKLIALSEDQSTTEGERSACLRRAHALMTKFSIDTIYDSETKEIVHQEFSLERSIFGLDVVKLCQILSTVGPPFGCYSYFKRSENKVYLMGFNVNCTIVDYTVHVLINQGCQEASAAYKLKPTANTKLAFWKGFLEGLKLRYNQIESEGTLELVVYDPVRKLFDESVRKVSVFSSGSDQDSMQRGVQSALDARVNAGLSRSGSSEQRKLG